jgi:hypothetical protein
MQFSLCVNCELKKNVMKGDVRNHKAVIFDVCSYYMQIEEYN